MKLVKESIGLEENVLYLNLEKHPPRKGPIELKGKVINPDSVHYGKNVDITFIFPTVSDYLIDGEKAYLGEDEVEYEFKIPPLNTWIRWTEEKPFFPKLYSAKYEGTECWLNLRNEGISITTDKAGWNSLIDHIKIGEKINLSDLYYMYTPEFINKLKNN